VSNEYTVGELRERLKNLPGRMLVRLVIIDDERVFRMEGSAHTAIVDKNNTFRIYANGEPSMPSDKETE
jgi:hypothetical protein